MKAGKWIMRAISAVVVSIVVSVIVVSAVLGWQARASIEEDKNKTKSAYTELTADISQEFRNIYIEAADDMEVRLEASDDGDCHVIYYNSNDVVHTVNVEGEELRVTCTDNRTFGSDLGFGDDPYITVKLPQKEYDIVKLVSDSGILQSNADMTCGTLELVQNKGDIYLTNLICGNLNITDVSGDLTMATINAGGILVEGGSGDVSAMNVSADSISLSVTSGKVEGYNVTADDNAVFATENGDILMQGCAGKTLEFGTAKGDVDVTLSEDMTLDVQSLSGKVELPDSPAESADVCRVHTESGDVRVAYATQ